MEVNRLKGFHILLVDDETDLLEMQKMVFELDGATVETAKSGNLGFEKFSPDSFDVIITDIRMKDGDGPSFIRRVREVDQKIPIIAMSGFSDFSREEIIEIGGNEFFTKPVPIKELIALLESFKS